MARPRKPTAHLELVGAFKHDPQRKREGEPVSDDPAMPHPSLSENGQKAFQFLLDTAVPGVLQKQDSAFVALAAEVLGQIWHGEDKPSIMDMHRAGQLLVRLGRTPTERSRVVVAKKDKPNPFSAFKKAGATGRLLCPMRRTLLPARW